MINPKNELGGMLKLCSVSLAMILCVACLAPVKEDVQPLNSQILAENSTMKKRLPLIERENDVLKKENLQQRMKLLELESQIKQQGLQIDSLNDKYDKDMTASAEQVLKLQETSQKLEKESSARIQELVSKNTALKARMAGEIQDLKAQMAKQNDTHIKERKRIMQENAKREFDLTARLDNLKKTLEAKDLEIASRKMAMDEIATKLGKTTALAESLKEARDAAAAELESVKVANAELVKKVNDLNALADSLKAARNAAAAELGSAKAANAELAKKVDVLSQQLPTQDNASSKTN